MFNNIDCVLFLLSNPNGVYHQEETYDESSDWWNMYYSLKTIHMAIRQKQ